MSPSSQEKYSANTATPACKSLLYAVLNRQEEALLALQLRVFSGPLFQSLGIADRKLHLQRLSLLPGEHLDVFELRMTGLHLPELVLRNGRLSAPHTIINKRFDHLQ